MPGEKVTVVGLTNAGDFAPVIVAPKFINECPGRCHLPAGHSYRGCQRNAGFTVCAGPGVILPVKIGEEAAISLR